ncbi:tautomerase family protein [Streptomyces sp. NPDC002851]
MPVLEVKLIAGVFTHEEKRRIVERLGEALIEITGEQMRPVTHTFITETPSGEWAIGSVAKTAEEINAMRHAQPVG